MSRLEEIRDRLSEITRALGDQDVSDAEAAKLAGEAAELTGEAAREATDAVERADRPG